MIEISNFKVYNFENAIRGARNPMNSWAKMDSFYDQEGNYILGEADLNLAKKLCKAGSDHRKFIRQILLSVDLNAPMYWWKEFDTYKVGTTANSTSTMHKIHSKPFEIDDFSHDKMNPVALSALNAVIETLEALRLIYIETKDKEVWYSIIQLLPSSYNQLRTVTMSYENLINMFHARKSHKLSEWHVYCDWIKSLPYANELVVDIRG